MRLFAFIMAILIAFPNIGSAFTAGDCCSDNAIIGEVLMKEAKIDVKSCCSHSPEKDGQNECGSECECASCFSPILYYGNRVTQTRAFETYHLKVAEFTASYFFELQINIWHPPKLA